jgi:peroxiredoxin
VVSPFVFSEDEPPPEEAGLDLFAPGAFQQAAATASRPAEKPVVAAAPAESEVPAWARPGAAPKEAVKPIETAAKAPPPARKKRTWVVDAVIITAVLCVLLMVVGYFGLHDMGQAMLRGIQETQQMAQVLTSRPPNTLEPTWTASATFTLVPSETFTLTPIPATPSLTPTLLYTRTNTAIPLGAVGITVGLFPPDFTLLDVATGGQVRLYDYLGQPILIFFWATWCPYCNDEIPNLEDLYKAYQDDGLVVLAIDGGESFAEVDAFRTSHGLTFPTLLDQGFDVATRYKAESIPHHVFIGLSGKIMFVETGELSYTDLENKVKATMRVFPTSTP